MNPHSSLLPSLPPPLSSHLKESHGIKRKTNGNTGHSIAAKTLPLFVDVSGFGFPPPVIGLPVLQTLKISGIQVDLTYIRHL